MNILYLGQFPVPTMHANSVQVVKMCGAFAANGHRVQLMVPGRDDRDLEEKTFSYYGMEKNFSIRAASLRPFRTRPFAYAMRCAIIAKAMKPDVVFGRSLHGCLAAALAGIPTIYESHQLPQGRLNPLFFRTLIRHKAFCHLVVISSALGKFYERLGVPAERMVIAHDAADLVDLAPDSMEHVGPVRRVGYVGHLFPGRGVEIIMELARRLPGIEFHIVGGRKVDIDYWKNRAVPDNLLFRGHFPHAQINGLLDTFDVLLAPYQRKVMVGGETDTSAWMSPLKIFEYMASGKAVICSDLPVLHEVHENGRTAIMVEPDHVDAWVSALQHLSDHPEVRSRIAKAAREKCEREFSWRRRADIVLNAEKRQDA